MKHAARNILAEALRLPERDRAAVAAELLGSLDPTRDEGAAALWEAEIARRIRELDEGRVKAVPWAEARRQILGEGGAVAFD